MIVVLVLMTSCHVSLKWKTGPVTIHTRMRPTAIANTGGRPQKCAASFAKREYQVALRIRGPPLSGHLESDGRQLKCSGFDGRFVVRPLFQPQRLACRKHADRFLQSPHLCFLFLCGIDPTDVVSPVRGRKTLEIMPRCRTLL